VRQRSWQTSTRERRKRSGSCVRIQIAALSRHESSARLATLA